MPRTPSDGLSVRLAEWKDHPDYHWPGRQLIAILDDRAASVLAFYAHPQGAAVAISQLDTREGHRGKGLASVLMDALYAAYPTAWINHGRREPDGALWWDRYTDPAPGRNIHNQPPQEWARYFLASGVAWDCTERATLNADLGVDGHRADEYRYGQQLEDEFTPYDDLFDPAPPSPPAPDPYREPLHIGHRVHLPPEVHAYVHSTDYSRQARAHALLECIGRDSLPRSTPYTGYWNLTAEQALADAFNAELFRAHPRHVRNPQGQLVRVPGGDPPLGPATHIVFHTAAAEADDSAHYIRTSSGHPGYVQFIDSGAVPLRLAGLSWRLASRQTAVTPLEQAVFPAPVQAAIEADMPRNTIDPTTTNLSAEEVQQRVNRIMNEHRHHPHQPAPHPHHRAQPQSPPPTHPPPPGHRPGR